VVVGGAWVDGPGVGFRSDATVFEFDAGVDVNGHIMYGDRSEI
jgi:hypothetical protein